MITWNPNIYLGSRCCFRCPGSPLFLVEPSRGFRSSEGFRSLFSTKKSAGSSFQRTSSERGPTGQGHVGHPLRSAWRRSGGVRTFTFAHLHGECRAARATFAEARERFSPFVREMAQKSPTEGTQNYETLVHSKSRLSMLDGGEGPSSEEQH